MTKLRRVSGQETIHALKRLGFVQVRQRGSLVVRGIEGEGIINSNIVAARFGNISLAYPQYDNDGVDFGLAAHQIQKISLKDQEGTNSYRNLDEPDNSVQKIDAWIRLI